MEEKQKKNYSLRNTMIATAIMAAIIALVFGLVGGYLALKFLTKSDKVENLLGQKTIEIQESAITNTVDKVGPSVVSITAEQTTRDFFGFLRTGTSAGTGFIVSEDGLILTNKHVVGSESASYTVITSDGKEYKATVKTRDPKYDIAILKIDGNDYSAVDLGDSDSLKVGQTAIAIGNALGQYQNTVTVGVISALGRAIEAGDYSSGESESLDNLIQTDAAINPGNSGGPLVNASGQVIGINTAIDSEAQGIGFSIPINVAKTALASYLERGKIVRPYIGVRYVPITADYAKKNNLPVDHGAIIYAQGDNLAVLPGSPAAKAGLAEGDIIIKVNDTTLTEGLGLVGALSKYKPGDKITITFIRDGKEQKVDLVLAEGS